MLLIFDYEKGSLLIFFKWPCTFKNILTVTTLNFKCSQSKNTCNEFFGYYRYDYYLFRQTNDFAIFEYGAQVRKIAAAVHLQMWPKQPHTFMQSKSSLAGAGCNYLRWRRPTTSKVRSTAAFLLRIRGGAHGLAGISNAIQRLRGWMT